MKNKNNNVVNKIKNVMLNSFQHPLHFLHASKVEILKHVQDDNMIRTARGFTLIELLVVVLIIGILAAVAVPQYQMAVAKSRFVQLQSDGDALVKSYQLYYLKNGTKPSTLDELEILPSGTLDDTKNKITNGNKECSIQYSELYCHWTDNTEAAWIYYFFVAGQHTEYKGKKFCRAFNEKQEKICLAMGGIKSSLQISPNYTHYVLP